MDTLAQENPDFFDPIPLHPLLRHRRCHEKAMFEENVRRKAIQLVTLIKPEIILYTTKDNPGAVYYMELSMNKKPNIGKNGWVYHFRSKVVAILNLSFEHRVRVGFLLTDNTMQIALIDQEFRWQSKGQIRGAAFDLERSHLMVYSRTLNALFWPFPSEQCDDADAQTDEKKWDVQMCNVNIRQQITVLRGLPEMELQALKDELVILFRRHGVLFLEYKQLKPLLPSHAGSNRLYIDKYERYHGCIAHRHTSHLGRDQNDGRTNETRDWSDRMRPHDEDSAIGSTFSDSTEMPPLQGIHWSPDMTYFESINDLNAFKPNRTKVVLRGHCHSKDQKRLYDRKTNNDEVKRVIALYGDIVYKLTPSTCVPLTSIKVPIDLVEPFQLMFLSRIVVVYNNRTIAGYMNSSTPVKVRKGEFLLAGYGIVVDNDGIFRIKMSLPKSYENEERDPYQHPPSPFLPIQT